MRKLLIAITAILLVLIIVNKDDSIHFNRYSEEITKITYNDIQLSCKDFETINDLLYEIEFHEKPTFNLENPIGTLSLTTIEETEYQFNIFPHDKIEYKHEGKSYYALADNEPLIDLYNKIKNKYTDLSFITIEPFNNTLKEDDNQVLLNDVDLKNSADNLLTFKFITKESLYNLKINNNIDDMIYIQDEVIKNDYIYITFLPGDMFKITFNNQYNYLIEITPNYDSNLNLLEFNRTVLGPAM